MEKPQIVRMIRNIRKSYETARERVQQAGIAIMEHAHAHGDCDLAKNLVWAMPPHLRAGVIGWFLAYSPIGVLEGTSEAKAKVRFLKPENKQYNDFNIEGAKANPWYEWMDQNIAREVSLLKAADFFANLERMLNKSIKEAKEGKKDGTDVFEAGETADVINGSEAILTAVRAIRQTQLASKAPTVTVDTSNLVPEAGAAREAA